MLLVGLEAVASAAAPGPRGQRLQISIAGGLSAAPGSAVTYRVTVRNRGRATARRVRLEVLFSLDRRLDSRDRRLVRVSLGSVRGGGSLRKRLRIKLPRRVADGRRRVFVCLRIGSQPRRCSARTLIVKARAVRPPASGAGPASAPGRPADPPAPLRPPAPDAPPRSEPRPEPPAPAPGPSDPPAAEPSTLAPPLSRSAPTSPFDASKYLFTGANAIQVGVEEGSIEARRIAVLHGTVKNRLGAAMPGVRVTVADHPAFGRTATQPDGGYELAVNGGGPLTLVFEREGYISAQRTVQTAWQGHAHVDPLVMIPYADESTLIDEDSGSETQVALGPEVSDADGSRQPVLVFDEGTVGRMRLPDGSERELGDMRVRMTEYTVGDTGPEAMPAQLPPTSAYTYALELSVDEAVTAGASEVTFSKPVVFYTDNFLGAPVGSHVPIGHYDRDEERWVAEPDGRVIEVVAEAGGSARVDVDGDGGSDAGAALSSLGIDAAELRRLASLYDPGAELWRTEITHFTSYDCNYPYDPGPGSEGPDNRKPDGDDEPECPPIPGSMIHCDSLMLAEALPIAGSDMRLYYRSDRVPGRTAARKLTIPLTGRTLPTSPEFRAVLLEVAVAGRLIEQRFDDPVPSMSHEFTWDGLDAEGRTVQGAQPASVRIGFVYGTPYTSLRAGASRRSTFAMPGDRSLDVRRGVVEYTRWQAFAVDLGSYTAEGLGLGGWTLSAHHSYDPASRRLYMGTGERRQVNARSARVLRPVANESFDEGFAGDGGPALSARLNRPGGVAAGPDGTLLVADTDNERIRVIGLDRKIDTYAGNGEYGFSGDGGPATAAGLSNPRDVAIAANGDAFIADTGANRIRRVTPDGTITTIAGGGHPADGVGDGGPATAARLSLPHSVAVGPDGLLYIADTGHSRIRVVNTDSTIMTLAGTGQAGFSGDGGYATQARLSLPRGLTLGADGDLLVADSGNGRVRRITPAGRIETVAGGGTPADGRGDGGTASAARLKTPTDVAVLPDGGILIVDAANFRIRRVTPEGVIQTHAGGGDSSADGAAAAAAYLEEPAGIAVTPDRHIYVSDASLHNLTVFRPLLDGFAEGDLFVASQDGSLVHQFDATGRHRRTRHALTDAVLHEFEYDGHGRLTDVNGPDGQLLTIQRSASGAPIALVARGGQTTTIGLDATGYLATLSNPEDEQVRLEHDAGGLLRKLSEPSGDAHVFTYDALGRLATATGPGGRTTRLARERTATGVRVTSTSAEGRARTYHTEDLPTGDVRTTVTDPAGAENVTTTRADGSVLVEPATGDDVEVFTDPDPRFGLEAPLSATEHVRTPGGRVRTTRRARTVTEGAGGRVASLTETLTVDRRTTRTVYTDDAGPGGTIVSTSPAGRRYTVKLDEQGRIVESRRAAGDHPVRQSYDDRGRLTRVEQGSRSWVYDYDGGDRPITRTDALGRALRLSYDDADRPVTLQTPSGRTWRTTYEADGHPQTLTLPLGQEYGFGFFRDGLAESLTLPGAGAGAYEVARSPDRSITRMTGPSGAGQTFDIAPDGRLQAVTGPETALGLSYEGTGPFVERVTWNRDGGEVEQALSLDHDGARTTGIDFTGRAEGAFAYVLDANLQPSRWTIDAAGTTRSHAITRDADRMMTAEGPWAITRDAASGRPMRYSDGTSSVDLAYDGHGALASRELAYGATQPYRLEIDYDAVGRIAQRRETVDGTLRTYAYGYDADDRLISVTEDGGTATTYAYDDNGNRTSGGATFDAQDRILTRGATPYSFDADGFLDRRGTDDFDYGRRGELLRARVAGHEITYDYDALGRLVRRQDGPDGTQFLYGDVANPLALTASIDAAGVLTTYFYDDTGVLHGLERAGARYAVGADQVGTPRVITDAAGVIVKRIERDAWGVVISDNDPSFALPIGFAGGIEDPATGLVRFGVRDYDPAAGRWTARDPSLFRGSPQNLYAYVNNDPVSLRDPSGLVCVAYKSRAGLGAGGSICWDGTSIVPAATCLELTLGVDVSCGVTLSSGVDSDAEIGDASLGPLNLGSEMQDTFPYDAGLAVGGTRGSVGVSGKFDAASGDLVGWTLGLGAGLPFSVTAGRRWCWTPSGPLATRLQGLGL